MMLGRLSLRQDRSVDFNSLVPSEVDQSRLDFQRTVTTYSKEMPTVLVDGSVKKRREGFFEHLKTVDSQKLQM
jgi:hypothetical protein